MGRVLAVLRSGEWLTRERIRLVAGAVLVASFAGVGYLIVTRNGLNDYQGRPLGTDFSNVYAAGTLVLEGRPEAAFYPAQHHAREQAIFGVETPFYGWHYPPFFLFVAGALALLPYLGALAVWQSVTFALYLLSIGAILSTSWPGLSRPSPDEAGQGSARGMSADHLWLLLAVAFPAVFVNLGHGHNGFLTAALIGGALVLLDRRPIVAGILLGLMAYKPQFGLMIPLVLIATGRWRTFGAAATTVTALIILSTVAFGPKVWSAFLESTHFTRVAILEDGNTGWHKIQSVFSWIRMWGGSVALAYAVQGGVMLALAGALGWLWRSEAAYRLKAAGLIIAAVLATPYSLDYDLMTLAPAIAFLTCDGLARGFRPYEKTALAALWLAPLIARSVAEATLIPLAMALMLLVLGLLLRRALAETGLTLPGILRPAR
jgi:alpha-1,2-mannosyltransferase